MTTDLYGVDLLVVDVDWERDEVGVLGDDV